MPLRTGCFDAGVVVVAVAVAVDLVLDDDSY
jgi:hypothetical protein